jgi:DNA-binding NtrC family response regulator
MMRPRPVPPFLPEETMIEATTHVEMDAANAASLKDLVAEFERRLIVDALDAARGNQRRAARALGVLPTTLNEKMKRLGIRPSDEERAA